MLYLSEAPSPLDIVEPDGSVIETLHPDIGDIIQVQNGIWHAAHRNQGPGNRVALIFTGYP